MNRRFDSKTLPMTRGSTNPPPAGHYPVIVVDEDAGTRQFVVRLLRGKGYSATWCESAGAVLERAAQIDGPVILVVEQRLAGMDGLEVLERLHVARPHDCEAVLMTAFADLDALGRAMNAGVFRCVQKPFHSEDMIAAVAGAANRLFLRLELRERSAQVKAQHEQLAQMTRQLRDSEERRASAERLEAVGRVAAGVAHEIASPLAAVAANVTMLEEQVAALRANARLDAAEGDAMEQTLVDVQQATDRIVGIATDLGVLSLREDRLDTVDLRAPIELALRVTRRHMPDAAHVDVALAPKLPRVIASEAYLTHTLVSSLLEAARAARADASTMPPGGAVVRVRAEVVSRGEVVTLAIEGPSVARRLRFAAVPAEIVTDACSRFAAAAAADGDDDVDADHDAAPISAVSAASAAAPRARVLAVDDDPLFLATVRRVLSPMHDVQTVTSARAALDLLQRGETFDVILCDLVMPQMSGMELHAEVLRVAAPAAARMVFVTGANAPQVETFLTSVPNPRLPKPFRVKDMRALVAHQAAALGAAATVAA